MKRLIQFLVARFMPKHHLKLKPIRKAGGQRKRKDNDGKGDGKNKAGHAGTGAGDLPGL